MENLAQKKRKENRYFDSNRRLLLEGYLQGKCGYPKITSKKELAKIFGCDRKTIYNEIERWLVEHLKTDLPTAIEYSAEVARNLARHEISSRGRDLQLGKDFALCDELKKLICKNHYSPYAVIQYFNLNGWPTQIRMCEKTLYNWINSEYIYGLTNHDLPNKGVKYRQKGSTKNYSRLKCAKHSIENRPKAADDRNNFGH